MNLILFAQVAWRPQKLTERLFLVVITLSVYFIFRVYKNGDEQKGVMKKNWVSITRWFILDFSAQQKLHRLTSEKRDLLMEGGTVECTT